MNEAVRVCETCHFKIVNKASAGGRESVAESGATPWNNPQPAQSPLSKEDEELQRAIAASLEISKKPTVHAPKPPAVNDADAGTLSCSFII